MGLRAGERISVRDLLYGLILRSGNDAAHALAIAAAGSEARFVRQMNLRAAALGLADTHYANPIGLDQRGNHSSARDLATLTQHLLRIPAFAKIADSRSAGLRSVRPPRRIESINELLRRSPVDDRGQDRPHLRGRLRAGRLGQAQGGRTDLGRDRRADRRSPLRGQPRTARMRLSPVPAADADPRRPGPRRRLDPLLRRRAAAARGAHGSSPASGAASGSKFDVQAPAEVEGPISRGAPLGRATVTSTGCRPARRRCARAGRSRRRAARPGARASSANTRFPPRWRCS